MTDPDSYNKGIHDAIDAIKQQCVDCKTRCNQHAISAGAEAIHDAYNAEGCQMCIDAVRKLLRQARSKLTVQT